MKTLTLICGVMLFALMGRGAIVTFNVTNSLGAADSTPVKIYPVASYINADGSVQTTGLPFFVLLTNGVGQVALLPGNYLATNSTLVSTYTGPGKFGTSQGVLFAVPNTTATYAFGLLAISGYNVFNYNGLASGTTNSFSVGAGTNVSIITNNGNVFIVQVPTQTFLTNGFTDKSITNGFVGPGITNGFTDKSVTNGFVGPGITNNFATIPYVQSATNGHVGAGITNGFATIPFVQGATNGFVGPAITNGFTGPGITNGFATVQALQAATNGFTDKSVTNGFVGPGITNGFAPTNYVGANYFLTANTNVYAPTNWVGLNFAPIGSAGSPTNGLAGTNLVSGATNGMNIGKGIFAFVPTNGYVTTDALAAATNTIYYFVTNTYSGGTTNTVLVVPTGSVLVGGSGLTFPPSGGSTTPQYSVLIGGKTNSIITAINGEAIGSAIIGGIFNEIADSVNNGVILGGEDTVIGTVAQDAAIIGGTNVIIYGTGVYAMGENLRISGPSSASDIVMGNGASTSHVGDFVWADDTTSSANQFVAGADNEFLIRAANGMGINTTSPGTNGLEVNGNIDSLVGLSIGGVPVTAITNGLAGTNLVSRATNGITPTAYAPVGSLLSSNNLPALTNGFVTVSITNGFVGPGITNGFATIQQLGLTNTAILTTASNLVTLTSNALAATLNTQATFANGLTNFWLGTNAPIIYLSQSNIVMTGSGDQGSVRWVFNQTSPTLWTNANGNGTYWTNQIGSGVFVQYNGAGSARYNIAATIGGTVTAVNGSLPVPVVTWGATLDGLASGLNIINVTSANYANVAGASTNSQLATQAIAANGATNLLTASYQPTTQFKYVANLNTNVLVAFGTSPDANQVFTWNTNATWVDSVGTSHAGAYTNIANTSIIVFDGSIGLVPFNEGPTNMNIFNGDGNFFTGVNFNTVQQAEFPSNGLWSVNNGTGTFAATNGIIASAGTNYFFNMAGGTNNFNLWNAIAALPYYQNATNQFGIRSGGVIVVPPGVSFMGAGQFLTYTPYNLTIQGSIGFGGCSVLVITNFSTGLPGLITLGTALNDSGEVYTKLSLQVKDLIICYQGDYTNAVFASEYASDCLMDNVKVMPWAAYITGDQWDLGTTTGSTNEIGIKIDGYGGQMVYLSKITTILNHIGLEIRADHPTVYGFDSETEGYNFNTGTTNSGWAKSDVRWLSSSLLWEGSRQTSTGFGLDVFYPHSYQSFCYFLNDSPTAPMNVWGGDYSETLPATFPEFRSLTVYPTNCFPTTFHYMHPYRGMTLPDRNVSLVGGQWSWSATNSWDTVDQWVTNNTTTPANVLSVGGIPEQITTPVLTTFTNATVQFAKPFCLVTNASIPTPPNGASAFWSSNGVLYWVTAQHPNGVLITPP